MSKACRFYLTVPKGQWQQNDQYEVNIQTEEGAQTEPAVGSQEQEVSTAVFVLELVKVLLKLPAHPQGSDGL